MNLKKYIYLILLFLLVASCSNSKVLFRNIPENIKVKIPEAVITYGDLIDVNISSLNNQSTSIFSPTTLGKIGTIRNAEARKLDGVYSIDDVTDFEKNIIFKDFKIRKNRPYLYIGLGLLIIILVVMIRALTKNNITEEQLIFNIKRFIRKNLSSVTLKMLEIEFNLDYNEINSINKNFKPAKYIKTERLDLTKNMLLNKKSISEISEKTGYSETYLLKNKYKFLR